MAQFAIRGYAVDALDYVLKPVPYFAFSQQLQKAVDRLRKRQTVYLTVPVEGGLRRVDVNGPLLPGQPRATRSGSTPSTGQLAPPPAASRAYEEKLAGPALCPLQQRATSSTWPRSPAVRQNTVQVGPPPAADQPSRARSPSWRPSPTTSEGAAK